MSELVRTTAAAALRAPFGFFQVAYVTSDLERAIRELGGLYGVTRFQVNRGVGIETTAGPAFAHFALAFLGEQQLEIIEPAGGADGAYRDSLPTSGYAARLHHFGQLIANADAWSALQAAARASGLPSPVGGTFRHEGVALMHYLYLDTRAQTGHYLEYMYPTAAGQDIFSQVPRF